MQKSQAQITINYFVNIYSNKPSLANIRPILQILGFEPSPYLSSSQIIIRLSDEVTFIDCSLSGPFTLQNNKIIQFTTEKGFIQYKKYSIVRLTDFVTKIDQQKICSIKVNIKNLQLLCELQFRYGYPAEFAQYLDNNQNKDELTKSSSDNQIKHNQSAINKESRNQVQASTSKVIKIEDDPQNTKKVIIHQAKDNSDSKGYVIKNLISQTTQPLTNDQILSGKQGYFIGRLLRMKLTTKQTKQGSMSVLILGFIDCNDQMVRVHMAGRIAIKENKELKKKKCYYIRGLQTYQTDKMPYPQIKAREKEFKISQIQNQKINELFKKSYYHWDHQLNSIQSQRVDVVGIIDEIEDKIAYTNLTPGQTRQVIRIVIRNIYKSVKVSFWAEQINNYKNAKLRKRDAIILEDIKKKKNLFLDFTHQSSIIKLDEQKQAREQVQSWLPEPTETKLPLCIGELSSYFSEEQMNSKVVPLNVYLTHLQIGRIIYKLCSSCKKKVQNNTSHCQCKCGVFQYKFNCQVEFSDASGGINCIAFDGPANKILNKTAEEIGKLNQKQLNDLVSEVMLQQYEIRIENKNLRYIVREVKPLSSKDYINMSDNNIKLIKSLINQKKQ